MKRGVAWILAAGWAASAAAQAPAVEDEILNTLNNLNVGPPAAPLGGKSAQAQALARSHLPTTADLGPGWRYAWEFPAGMTHRAASEAEYWRKADLGEWGQTAEFMKTKMAFLMMQMTSAGLRPRDGLLSVMVTARHDCDSAAERMAAEMEAAARALASVPPPTHRRRSPSSVTSFAGPAAEAGGSTVSAPAPTPQEAQRKLLDAVNEPYRNLTDAQLQEQAIRRLTFARQRTVLIYGRCNDWNGMETARSTRELTERRIEASILTVKLTLGDPAALDLVPDLTPEIRTTLEARINKALRSVMDPMILREQIELEDEEAESTPPQNPEYRARWEADRRERREAFERKKAAVAQTRAGVDILNAGDHAHEVSFQNLPPESSGVSMAHRSATIRIGSAFLDITFESVGRRPEADIAAEARSLYPIFSRKLAAALGQPSP